MVARGDVVWADLGHQGGRRPVCVVTRSAAIEVLLSLTCAPITRTVRGIRSEVRVGRREGLPATSVISCDNLVTIRKERLDEVVVGRLGRGKRVELDQALRFALGIRY